MCFECQSSLPASDLVRAVGIEPTLREERVFETRASTGSATPAQSYRTALTALGQATFVAATVSASESRPVEVAGR